MTSRSLPVSSGPKRSHKNTKGPGESHVGKGAQKSTGNSGHPSVYDFPDSDDSTPASASRSKPTPQTRNQEPRPRETHSHTSSKDSVRVFSASKREPNEARKRKHAKAFELDNNVALKASREKAGGSSLMHTKRHALGRVSIQASVTKEADAPRSEPPVTLRRKPDIIKSPVAAQDSRSAGLQHMPVPSPPQPIRTNSKPSSRNRQPRLIDRLAAQKTEESEDSGGSNSPAPTDSESSDNEQLQVDTTSELPVTTPLSQRSMREREVWARPAPGPPGLASSKKIRHTYSQARSIRGETQSQDDPFGLSSDLQTDALDSTPPGKPNAFAFPADEFDMDDEDDEEGDEETKITIKSVHELRRAGANNRFADEMEDLLSRIGTPTRQNISMRRNALLELAQKLQRDDFACQFRDHAARDNVAKSIGMEEDVVSGFALAASLIHFLTSHHAPHLIRRLVEEEVGKLIDRLIGTSEDIVALAGHKSANMSKAGRERLGDIKLGLTRLDIWHERQVGYVSPQLASLQLLHIVLRNVESRHRGAVIAGAGKQLSRLISSCQDVGDDNDALSALVLLVLECEGEADSKTSDVTQGGERAIASAFYFQKTLTRWPNRRRELDSASLKLAINITNTRQGAHIFSDQALLESLVSSISEGLDQVQRSVDKGALENSMYDGLLLLLGVMINILEHCTSARLALDDVSLKRLANLYIANRKAVGDADSEDRSKISVAVGYLAVSLGYLCLESRGRVTMKECSYGAGVMDLIDTIKEFIGLYRTVDSKMHELESLVNDLRRLDRLR